MPSKVFPVLVRRCSFKKVPFLKALSLFKAGKKGDAAEKKV